MILVELYRPLAVICLFFLIGTVSASPQIVTPTPEVTVKEMPVNADDDKVGVICVSVCVSLCVCLCDFV